MKGTRLTERWDTALSRQCRKVALLQYRVVCHQLFRITGRAGSWVAGVRAERHCKAAAQIRRGHAGRCREVDMGQSNGP